MKQILVLIFFLLAAFGVAAVGGQFMPGDWYTGLVKPSWNPPSWVFGPVWTILYMTIAVSGWLVWKQVGFLEGRVAMLVYLVQLVLNGAWSWIFFGLHRPGLAFAEILVLWISIVSLVVLFWRIRPLAGAMLLPYAAWVAFAAVLNGTIWRLNL
ncbi:MAG: tryptophan-rich sensory protein [bacterium]|nr:tryptophan-rich sensory protein [bacterium]